jgi:CubicO group peptidase (beta-lactamase class C family)
MGDAGGTCDQRFGPVRDAFVDVLRGAPAGSALAVWQDGGLVVDLWGGPARTASGQGRWGPETLAMPYSVSKPFAAVCALLLAARGALDIDAMASRYWPELACPATVRQLLSHSAGLVVLDEPVPMATLWDWDELCARLAVQRPVFEPGSAVAESALFYGHLVGELVRRVDGRTLGRFLAEEVCGPASLDIHLGLGPAELQRVADLVAAPGFGRGPGGGPLRDAAVSNPAGLRDVAVVNSESWRRAEIPAVNVHATARAVAQFYGLLARGDVLPPALVAEMATAQASGTDLVTGSAAVWGLGVGIEPDGWGMGGMGGSLGWWSEEGRYAIGFVTAYLDDHERSLLLENTVRGCLGLPPVA